MQNYSGLAGKLALVCGASQGMGLASAKLLSEQGLGIIGVARNKNKLEESFLQLSPQAKHYCLTVDFSDLNSVRELIEELTRLKLQPEILVNNSGGPRPCTATSASPEAYLKAFTQHLIANSILSQALIPAMRDKNYGRIINIVSIAAKVPSDNLASSNTVRAAVLNWAKTLSNELAPLGITVNNVLPGYTETERLKEVLDARARTQNTEIKNIEEKILSKIPMKRFARAEEIAAAVVFLASPAASYITGISLAVDGGYIPSS
jgi:3-oxoacyl-[acyl-carrier protein] reductase